MTSDDEYEIIVRHKKIVDISRGDTETRFEKVARYGQNIEGAFRYSTRHVPGSKQRVLNDFKRQARRLRY